MTLSNSLDCVVLHWIVGQALGGGKRGGRSEGEGGGGAERREQDDMRTYSEADQERDEGVWLTRYLRCSIRRSWGGRDSGKVWRKEREREREVLVMEVVAWKQGSAVRSEQRGREQYLRSSLWLRSKCSIPES